MRAFYLSCEIVQQLVGQLSDLPFFKIPWGHNVTLISKLKHNDQRIWYAKKAIEDGWSRQALERMIKSDLYSRQGKAITNFNEKLPNPQSHLANDILKSPYNFDFLTLTSEYDERELEQGLVDHIQKFLIELGKGFAFVGRQYHIEVEGRDYYIDLLFVRSASLALSMQDELLTPWWLNSTSLDIGVTV